MINKIPFFGWILSAMGAISLSIPFWLCWTIGGIGEKYFSWIPEVYQVIPFWHCVSLFIVIAILKGTLTPKLFSISNTQTVASEKE
jgi:hypothetical protein